MAGSPFVPDRRISLIARAEGFRDGLGTLATRGTGVGGPVIISQYTETPSGSAPKAIEIMNVGSRAIAFAAEPLEIRYFASGSAVGAREIFAESGRLPARAVVVIGDSTTAQHLIARGLLRATASQVANAQTGAIFTDTGEPNGRAVYIKRGFLFNGDDALEVRLNGRRCDVFGTIGHDPGSAWSAAGVSTANQNLSRRRTAIAPSSGWTNPSLVFETAGTSLATALDGFGVAPPLDDPYAEWAAARGLSGAAAEIDADPDANGLPNGIEFVFGDAGPRLSPPGPAAGQWQWQLDAQARHRIGALRWGVATFDSPAGWVTRWEEPSPAVPAMPNAGEFRPLTLRLPASDAAAGLARVFVVRP